MHVVVGLYAEFPKFLSWLKLIPSVQVALHAGVASMATHCGREPLVWCSHGAHVYGWQVPVEPYAPPVTTPLETQNCHALSG